MKSAGSLNRSRIADSLMLLQMAAESEGELLRKSFFASSHDGESEKSASQRKRISRLED
jgi:hypothetical protein